MQALGNQKSCTTRLADLCGFHVGCVVATALWYATDFELLLYHPTSMGPLSSVEHCATPHTGTPGTLMSRSFRQQHCVRPLTPSSSRTAQLEPAQALVRGLMARMAPAPRPGPSPQQTSHSWWRATSTASGASSRRMCLTRCGEWLLGACVLCLGTGFVCMRQRALNAWPP